MIINILDTQTFTKPIDQVEIIVNYWNLTDTLLVNYYYYSNGVKTDYYNSQDKDHMNTILFSQDDINNWINSNYSSDYLTNMCLSKLNLSKV